MMGLFHSSSEDTHCQPQKAGGRQTVLATFHISSLLTTLLTAYTVSKYNVWQNVITMKGETAGSFVVVKWIVHSSQLLTKAPRQLRGLLLELTCTSTPSPARIRHFERSLGPLELANIAYNFCLAHGREEGSHFGRRGSGNHPSADRCFCPCGVQSTAGASMLHIQAFPDCEELEGALHHPQCNGTRAQGVRATKCYTSVGQQGGWGWGGCHKG